MTAADRLKAPLQTLLGRAGYTLFKDRPPRDIGVPQPVEVAAQRLLLRALIERIGVNCVIDVGAHRGEYGRLLRNAGYRGEIVSLEPSAESFRVLERQAEGDPAWRVHRLALGRESGRERLQVARATNFSSFLRPTRFSLQVFGTSAVEREEEVQVERLDAVFDRLVQHVPDPRVLLKTDTQGWDLQVIEGAEHVLDRVLALQVELSVQPIYDGAVGWLDALAWLEAKGFRPAHLTTVMRDGELGVIELDGLFIRSPGTQRPHR